METKDFALTSQTIQQADFVVGMQRSFAMRHANNGGAVDISAGMYADRINTLLPLFAVPQK